MYKKFKRNTQNKKKTNAHINQSEICPCLLFKGSLLAAENLLYRRASLQFARLPPMSMVALLLVVVLLLQLLVVPPGVITG